MKVNVVKSKLKYFIFLATILILVILSYGQFRNDMNDDSMTSKKYNYEYFNSNYSLEDSKDLVNVIELSMKQPEIIYNHTSTSQVEDLNFCNVIYSVRIKNITSKPMDIFVQYLIPKELSDALGYSSTQFGSLDNSLITLQPGKGYSADSGIIMKHFEKLSDKEMEIYNMYSQDLYVIILIDGKVYFTKIDNLSVVG